LNCYYHYCYDIDQILEESSSNYLQVAPAELESLILTHPHVYDVAVIGVPDSSAGEVPKAFVVAKRGSNLTEDQVKEFVAGQQQVYSDGHQLLFE